MLRYLRPIKTASATSETSRRLVGRAPSKVPLSSRRFSAAAGAAVAARITGKHKRSQHQSDDENFSQLESTSRSFRTVHQRHSHGHKLSQTRWEIINNSVHTCARTHARQWEHGKPIGVKIDALCSVVVEVVQSPPMCKSDEMISGWKPSVAQRSAMV